MYDKAYNDWDEMTVKERISWAKRNEIGLSSEEANHDADWLSENEYCLWTAIREILVEEQITIKRYTIMKTTEVNSSLIGKRVKGIFTALEVTGSITAIYEDEYSKGVEIKLDKPVVWGDYTYYKYTSTARKYDDWGNLKYTELI